MGRLAGRSAIVTGAAQGLGAAFAKALAAEGAAVVLVDLDDAEPVARAIRDLGGQALALTADVSDEPDMQAVARQTHEAFGGPDILVNNAAIAATLTRTPFDQIPLADWDRVMAVNARGPFVCARAVTPFMREAGYGKIINIGSDMASAGKPFLLHYVTAKGGVATFTKALARELGESGVRVNCVIPGFTLSENILANPVYSPEVRDRIIAPRALPRHAGPDDVVGAVVFFASAESDFVTGQSLLVEGGATMA